MFVPWKWISPIIGEKPIIGDRASLYFADGENSDLARSVKEIKFIYTMLAYIDSKASALMRFDGVILAVLALVAQQKPSILIGIFLAGVALLVFLSIACCVLVIDISWRFLEIAVEEEGTLNVASELSELRKVLYFRESAYRGAWILSACAMILMFVGALLFVGAGV